MIGFQKLLRKVQSRRTFDKQPLQMFWEIALTHFCWVSHKFLSISYDSRENFEARKYLKLYRCLKIIKPHFYYFSIVFRARITYAYFYIFLYTRATAIFHTLWQLIGRNCWDILCKQKFTKRSLMIRSLLACLVHEQRVHFLDFNLLNYGLSKSHL